MTVPLFSQSLVMELEVVISEDSHVSPVMESVVEGLRASSPHENLATFTALLCNGSDTAQVSEGNEVSETNGAMSVRKDGSENECSDTG